MEPHEITSWKISLSNTNLHETKQYLVVSKSYYQISLMANHVMKPLFLSYQKALEVKIAYSYIKQGHLYRLEDSPFT